ncbi:hypothetical protein [Flavobacterium sp.]|uniref:hypothetical protein n=1 Tax=Flavobacterium sp. TaxID=239 RepID=UPI004048090E
MKLISMTDFVLDKYKNAPLEDYDQVNETFINSVIKYAEFLKQPLKLEMFVPCDEDGNILEEPDQEFELTFWDYSTKMSKYEQAKEKVLFEINKRYYPELIIELNTDIQSITTLDIELTPNAIKRIFG